VVERAISSYGRQFKWLNKLPRTAANCSSGWTPIVQIYFVSSLSLGWNHKCSKKLNLLNSLDLYT